MDVIADYIIATLPIIISKRLDLDFEEVEQTICEAFYDENNIPMIEPETEIFKPTSSWVLVGTKYVVKGKNIIDVIGKIDGDQFIDLEVSDVYILNKNFIKYTIHKLNTSKHIFKEKEEEIIELNKEDDVDVNDVNNDDESDKDDNVEKSSNNDTNDDTDNEKEEIDYESSEEEKPIKIKKKISKNIEIIINKKTRTFEIKKYDEMKKWIDKEKINYKFTKEQYDKLIKANNNNMPCFKPKKNISFIFE